ncbi:MAG: glycosyltransferase family 4 protein [Desulfovibrionaceae bacterium]|nr:glycosyltransferase family 4 protein [Desulfovibrionaceae bacterium]
MNPKEKVIVVTWFYKDSPGWLDYRYRVSSIRERYDYLLVSNLREAQIELEVPDDSFHLLCGENTNFYYYWFYWLKVFFLLFKYKDNKVVFLSSFFAPMSSLFFLKRYILYWNEHPTHAYPDEGHFFKRIKNNIMLKLSYRGAKYANPVMPISIFQKDDLIAHGVKSDCISLIPMGVQDSFINHNDSDKEYDCNLALEIIYTGTVVRDRGRDVMLEALSIIKNTDIKIHLTMVGATPDQIALCSNLIDEYDISGFVTINGRVSGDLIPTILHKADLGICIWDDKPYWKFNPPTKLFEYLVAGLPVLVSRIRTHTEYVENKYSGIVFDYNANSLATALCYVWENRERLSEWKENAKVEGNKYLWRNIEPDFLVAID